MQTPGGGCRTADVPAAVHESTTDMRNTIHTREYRAVAGEEAIVAPVVGDECREGVADSRISMTLSAEVRSIERHVHALPPVPVGGGSCTL